MQFLSDFIDRLRDLPALVQWAGYVGLTLIVFVETGLLVGFFLPGDSLLVTAGLLASQPDFGLNVWLLGGILTVAAIVGDTVGYHIGKATGPRIFTRQDSLLFNKAHLLRAQAFYEKHGGKTIILARFMPLIRTFAPVVAGAAKMNYRRFFMFNVVGGVSWIISMLLIGYAITPLLDPLLKRVFGDAFETAHHVEKVIIIVVFISITPGLYAGGKAWLARRKKKNEEATAVV